MIIIQIIASVFLKGAMDELLNLFFTLQVIVALKVYDTSLPANIDEFAIKTKEVIQFEFLKPEILMAVFMPGFNLYRYLGFDIDQIQDSLLSQCGSFISIILLAFIVIFFMIIFRVVKRFKEKIDAMLKEIMK